MGQSYPYGCSLAPAGAFSPYAAPVIEYYLPADGKAEAGAPQFVTGLILFVELFENIFDLIRFQPRSLIADGSHDTLGILPRSYPYDASLW